MISNNDRFLIEQYLILLLFASSQFHGLYLDDLHEERGIDIYVNYTAQLYKIPPAHHVQAGIVLHFIECINQQFSQKKMNVCTVKYFPKLNSHEAINVTIGRISSETRNHSLEISAELFDLGLTEGEIKAVMAHEMGHIYANHFSSFSKLNYTFYMILYTLTKGMGLLFLYSLYSKRETCEYFTIFIAGLIPLIFFANKLQHQELEADLLAVNIFQANPEDLNSSLHKIHNHNLAKEAKSIVTPFFRRLYSGAGFLATHPSLQEREAVLTRLNLV